MGLSKRKNRPEEIVRQRLIHLMVEKLGYPLCYIAVEKELAQLPHLNLSLLKDIPKRRIDIVVFSKKNSAASLSPLILIECKAVTLTPKMAQQVIGYNTVVQAPFLALVNATQILTGSYDDQAGMYRFTQGLLPYEELIKEGLSRMKSAPMR